MLFVFLCRVAVGSDPNGFGNVPLARASFLLLYPHRSDSKRSVALSSCAIAQASLSCTRVRVGGMSGERKRRKTSVDADLLQELLHTGSISTVGLAALLQKLKGADLSNPPASSTLQAENLKGFDRVGHQERLQLVGGGTFLWNLLRPNKLLTDTTERSVAFQHHMKVAYERYPCSPSRPWRLVIAFDEFVPGLNYLLPGVHLSYKIVRPCGLAVGPLFFGSISEVGVAQPPMHR